MSKQKIPSTQAIRFLKTKNADFTLHAYTYEDRGGTHLSAQKLSLDEHLVIKTLVMEDETGRPLIILMHGDREVSTRAMARFLGVKAITPCDPQTAHRHTGYLVGGTSPFGLKKRLPVYMEKTIVDLPELFINAGTRGLLAGMNPTQLIGLLEPVLVNVAI